MGKDTIREIIGKTKSGLVSKFSTLIILISLTLLLTGCVGGGDTSPHQDYHTGKEGVVAKFMEGSPPETITTGMQVPIIVDVQNKGAVDTTAYLFLSGFDTTILQTTTSASFSLHGKSLPYPEGERVIKKFSTATAQLPDETEIFNNLQLLLTTCYSYKTEASLKICVDPNPASGTRKVCNAGASINLGSGQGAPVAVTSIKQEPTVGATNLLITIQNVGGGTVISNSKVSSCLETTYTDENKVIVDKVTLGGKPIDCGTNEIYLDSQGKGFLSCFADLQGSQKDAYETLLTIILSYGYKKTTDSKTVTIIKGRR